MRLFWIFFLIYPLFGRAESNEEALFLRRIAEFWQEGEYQIAKNQIEEFIVQHPESSYSDPLCAALGDLFLREKNFTSALDYYGRVRTPDFYSRVFFNRMQCLYEMQWYATLADECESYLENGHNLHATYFLAIALYHQCLNASKDPELLVKLAERAKPHFETLSQSELSEEVAQGYAHLCCILKDFHKASEIYLDLAKKNFESEEELLFQAGLIQSEYNKELALKTFDDLAKNGQKKAKEAAYNRLIIAFDLGRYEDLTQENLLEEIPSDRLEMGHLFIGRSLLKLKKYSAAVNEFKAYLQKASVSETFHTALLSLLEASYQSNDLESLELAIGNLTSVYPHDPELPKAYFSRAQILKKNQNFSAAKNQLEELLTQFPAFPQRAQVTFELTHLEHKLKQWDKCYQKAKSFLAEFPEHELSSFVWRYLISSSTELASGKPDLQTQLIVDLEEFLKQPLADPEKLEWQLLLAKVFYEQQNYVQAQSILQNIQTPDSCLLLALCHRDGAKNLELFCETAEKALQEGATLIDPGQMHISLFNAYLELAQTEKSADHLFSAFQAKAEIKPENLLWLADVYLNAIDQGENTFLLAHRVAEILQTCKTALHADSKDWVSAKLAKAYSILGKTKEAIALLETISSPDLESQLLLAQSYAKKGIQSQALQMFNEIVAASTTLRTSISATAALQAARLNLQNKNPDLTKIATQLKNLVLQKTFEAEPAYLEAALDYVDIQSNKDLKKRISLLEKTKLDFEKKEDLLSKDYHEARTKSPQKDKLYRGYLQLMDADILAAQACLEKQNQNGLRAKSKELLMQIVNEQTASPLLERARMLLTSIDDSKQKA